MQHRTDCGSVGHVSWLPKVGHMEYILAGYQLHISPSELAAIRGGRVAVSEWNRAGWGAVYTYFACLSGTLLPQTVDIPSDEELWPVFTSLLPPPGSSKLAIPAKELTKEDEMSLWPVKAVDGALTKVNVFARDVLACSKKTTDFWARVLPAGLTNDQAAGLMIWVESVTALGAPERFCRQVGEDLVAGAARLKHLSDRLKMLGLASSLAARSVIELPTLLGRGVGGDDGKADAARRTDMSCARERLATVPPELLRPAVRSVIRDCMRERIRPKLVEHVRDRAIWAKSGGHSNSWSKWGGNVVETPAKARTRAAYLASRPASELLGATPRVDISQAAKLEHGKTRWIYSCDSVSYLYFDTLLREVERVWDNTSVMIKPDLGGPEAEAMLCPPHGGETYVMLDYTDFNSQHTLEAMRMCFEELAAMCEDGDGVLRWCTASFDNMYLDGVKWVAGLPSGHRATTFINTVLNASYVRACIPRPPKRSYHAGDDVLLVYDAVVRPSDFLFPEARFNESKQSYGPRAEFLRKHHSGNNVYGYPARSIAGLVSGNWVSEAIRDCKDTVRPMILQIDAIESRFANLYLMCHMLERSVARAARCGCVQARLLVRRQVECPGLICRSTPLLAMNVADGGTRRERDRAVGVGVADAVGARLGLLDARERSMAVSLLEERLAPVTSRARPTFSFRPVIRLPRQWAPPSIRRPAAELPGTDSFVELVRRRVRELRLRGTDRHSLSIEGVGAQVVARLGIAAETALAVVTAGRCTIPRSAANVYV